MQLMILEQQNRARLYKARMENINQVVAGREIETSNFLARDEYSQMRHQYNPRLSQTVMPQLPADSVISAKKPMDCSNAMNLSPSPHGETLNASTIERQNADVQNIRIRQDHYLRAMKQQRQILEAQKRQMTDIAKSTPNFAPVMSTNGCRRLLPSLHTLQVHGEQIASSIAAQEAVKPIPLDPRLFYHSMAQASHQTPVGSSVANGSKPRPIHPPVGLTGPAASLVNADAMSMNKKDVHAVRVPKVQLYCDRCDSGITNSHYHCRFVSPKYLPCDSK